MPSSVTTPTVTVGLPVYNADGYLPEALQSVLTQSLSNLELIISDNGSHDGTQEICRSYQRDDPRVRYIRSETNRGVAWNHNRVLALASAPNFCWFAGDDLLEPNHLSQVMGPLDQDPLLVGSASGLSRFRDDSADLEMYMLDPLLADDPLLRLRRLLSPTQGHSRWLLGTTAVVRTSVLRGIGGYPSHVEGDKTLSVLLALTGRVAVSNAFSYHLRSHPERLSEKRGRRRADWVRQHDPTWSGRVAYPYWHQQADMYRLLGNCSLISRSTKLRALFVLLRDVSYDNRAKLAMDVFEPMKRYVPMS